METNDTFPIADLSPNPASNYFVFTYTGGKIKEEIDIYIHNTLGQLVLYKKITDISPLSQQTIKVNELSSGIYFVKFTNNEFEKTFKINIAK